jgi:hypothetical protein
MGTEYYEWHLHVPSALLPAVVAVAVAVAAAVAVYGRKWTDVCHLRTNVPSEVDERNPL